MKSVSRRSVTTGLAAAVTVIPALGLCVGLTRATAEDRIKAALDELAAAFADYYRGAKIQVTFSGTKPSMIEHGSVAVGMVLADRLHEEHVLLRRRP